jgi:hypothetical protein
MGGETQEGDVDHRSMGQGGNHGTQQALWESQQQGPLKLGEEGQKGRILQQREMPALEAFHNPTLRKGAPQAVHAETNALNVSQTYGHGQGEARTEEPMKQQKAPIF